MGVASRFAHFSCGLNWRVTSIFSTHFWLRFVNEGGFYSKKYGTHLVVMCTNGGMHVVLFTDTCWSHLQSRYLYDNRMVMLCFVFMLLINTYKQCWFSSKVYVDLIL